MKTDDLIAGLAGTLTPIQRFNPWTRASVWMAAAAVYLAIVTAMVVVGLSHSGASSDPLYVVQQLAALAAGITGAVAAFLSVVPGRSRRVIAWPLGAVLVWLLAVLWGCARDLQSSGTLGFASQTDWPCVISISAGGVLLWAVMLSMLRRGAPVTPATTAMLGGLAALGVANVEACLTRPHAFSGIVLLWHGGTVLVMTAIFTSTGGRLLRWPSSALRATRRKSHR